MHLMEGMEWCADLKFHYCSRGKDVHVHRLAEIDKTDLESEEWKFGFIEEKGKGPKWRSCLF